MKIVSNAALALAALPWLAACSSPTSSSPTFKVTFTSNPDPAVASASSGVQYKVTNADSSVSYYDYAYATHFSLHIQEDSGIDLNITSINLTVQQATGGIVITPSGGDQVYFKFNSSAPQNHINSKGTADIGFDVWYSLPSGGKESLITVAFNFTHTDSSNNTYTYTDTASVKVAP